jgi:single-stranded DNA-specific DHH superfamily exonuclease
MLTEKQISEIREHLENAKNPIFYYDNDADGLCSYVLLRKFIDRGKGVAVKSFPDLDRGYARKAQELNADYVFVLDKPVLSKEFVDAISELGLPIIWIDHHNVEGEDYGDKVQIYNPSKNKGQERSEEPVTYWCYKITNRREDVWLAVAGCIADHHLPDFLDEFEEKYSEFWGKNIKEPFDAYYGTEIGKIAQAINFGLKDSVSNVVRLQNFLISVKKPLEVFSETGGNYAFRKKIAEIRKKYGELFGRAENCIEDNLIFFDYGGDLSISADLSNELSHKYKNKYIIVAYRNGAVANLSGRGKDIKQILERVLERIDGRGGGHNDAIGAQVKVEDLERFKDLFKREIGE